MKNIKLLIIILISMRIVVYAGGDLAVITPYENEDNNRAIIVPYEQIPKTISRETPTIKVTPKVIKEKKKILANGFYVGLGLAGSRYKNDVVTSKSLGLIGKVGYDFNSYIGIEANGLQSMVKDNDFDISHIGLFLKPMMPIGQLLNIYGLVGVATTHISKSEIQDFAYGVGLQLDLSKEKEKDAQYSRDFNGKGDQETGMGFFLEYQKATPNLDVISTGVTYAF